LSSVALNRPAYSVSGGWEGLEISFALEVYAGDGGGNREPPLLGSFRATTGEANNQYNLFGVVEEPKGTSFTVLPLRNSQPGEVLGEYEVAVTLTPKEKATTTVLCTATARITQRTRLYDVGAQVSLPSIDVDASCEALEVTTR